MRKEVSGAEAAKSAGLRYVQDEAVKGISRSGTPGNFRYRLPSGKIVRDRTTLNRIRALAIPPAWKQVWIAPTADAHLQATGRDAKGRKQYRYHAGFAAIRDADKYAHLVAFAEGLPALRRRLKADLRRPGLPREKVLAGIVTLLEESLIRVGNEDYARDNHSYGLTTLRNGHVKVRGKVMRFLFTGKSGKRWDLSIRDRRVARMVRACQELPGQHLFEYRNGDGVVHAVSSTEVNAYLREISGRDITAKDFRTWAGTVEAAKAFARSEGEPSKKLVREVVSQVAARLGNTVAVCRKCYIHPAVIEAFEQHRLKLPPGGAESAVLRLLRKAARHA
jgi:DNA topoisomerase-1